MKRFLSIVLAVLLLLCGVAFAASEGIEYQYDDRYEIYKVQGRGTCTDEEIVIPNEYEGKPVTWIQPDAFSQDENLKKIVLPESLKSVGSDAFAACKNLEYNELNGCAYLGSENNPYLLLWKVVDKEITEIVLPEETVIVYPGAFSGLKNLTSVTLNDGLEQLSDFAGCTSLKEAVIPASVGSIFRAFSFCTSLEKVTCLGMPAINDMTFLECTSLKEITLQPQGFGDPMIPIPACENGFTNLPALTDIHFGGTMDDFYGRIAANTIQVSYPVTVHCTDGDIALAPAA